MLLLNEYHPESSEELAIWEELTRPENHNSLTKLIESNYPESIKSEKNDFATNLHKTLLTDSARRNAQESAKGMTNINPSSNNNDSLIMASGGTI